MAARLPIRVCLDDFDHTARRSITKAQIRELQSLGWLKDGRSLLLIGQTGVGNLRCVYCQNWDISQEGEGRTVSPDELANMMLALQAIGCHNINLVSPSHVVA
jgi:pyruvate-formate lyase-activating enzyme